jgi:DNA modification methylase
MKEKKEIGGLLMQSWTSHPLFYPQKCAKEKELGRELTTAEFLEKHFIPPTDDAYSSGTSIFDPVLCELAYRWFCPDGGTILDPFAGGSVRGIVASHCNRQYIGVELRKEQVDANLAQQDIATDPQPVWYCGDSRSIDRICSDVQADFLFSCPPYADLEVYSDNPADLSTLSYSEFRPAYFEIIHKASSLLRDDRFACFVVGDVRDNKGNYYNFVGDTVEAFRAAGLHYYNEAILVTAVGSLPIRAGKQFGSSRKLGKTHQNVLVFVKGDGKRAAANCGECQFGDLDLAQEFGEVLQ